MFQRRVLVADASHRKLKSRCVGTSCGLSRVKGVRLCASMDKGETETGTERERDLVVSKERGEEADAVDINGEEWQRVKGLAERSMFAACTALLYLIGFSFRLEG